MHTQNDGDSIEELAVRLKHTYYFNSSTKYDWLDLSRMVKIIEIEARLDEVNIGMTCDSERRDKMRLSELREQLNTLKGMLTPTESQDIPKHKNISIFGD